MPTLSFHDKQHVLRLLQQQGQVKNIFDGFVRRSSLILTKWTEKNTDNVWIRNAGLEKQIDKLLIDLHDNILTNIETNTDGAWEAANLKNDDLLKAFIKDMALPEIIGKSKFEVLEKGMFSRNLDALKAFHQRRINGLTVSDRVWQTVDGAKENLEYYLSSGISTGRPAAIISQDIRQLLKDPDKRFRRVKNEKGKLVLSQPMKYFHPGQGRYRSSYMNALRLSATETNQAYHAADYERWKQQDFVLGIEIFRSKSNKGPCPICDQMVGRYPKDYKFTGNHPWCICQAVPIMLEGEEYIDYLLTGEVPQQKIIKTVPQSALDWVNEEGKASRHNELFVKENSKYFFKHKDYEVNIDKLKEKGFYVSGINTAEYKEAMGNFNIEQLDRDISSLNTKYGIRVQSKELSSYFGETKIEYVGDNDFRLTRSFSNRTVYHETFKVPENIQGRGYAKEVFKSLYKQYQNAGIERIELTANLSVGGYSWAKYGFKAKADRYDDLLSWANFLKEDNTLTKNEFIDFENWITTYRNQDIPMWELTNKKYGKKFLLGSTWRGFLDLTDEKQKNILENYLFR